MKFRLWNKQKIQNKIKRADALPVYLKPKLLNALEPLPAGNKVCHGDFHPDNIIMKKNMLLTPAILDARNYWSVIFFIRKNN